MLDIVKQSHTATLGPTGPTGFRKTQLVLNLLKKEYRHHFDNIVILCPTLRWNETYKYCPLLWSDDRVYLREPGDQLLAELEALPKHFASEETLFIIDDCIGNEDLDKMRGA